MDIQQEQEVSNPIPITLPTHNVAGGARDSIIHISSIATTAPPLHENIVSITENAGAIDGTAAQKPKKKKKNKV